MQNIKHIIVTCLNQKINFDPSVDDTGREWWYISPLFAEGQKIPEMPVDELAQAIKDLKFSSIKDVTTFDKFKRMFIQIRGNREEIINECLKN